MVTHMLRGSGTGATTLAAGCVRPPWRRGDPCPAAGPGRRPAGLPPGWFLGGWPVNEVPGAGTAGILCPGFLAGEDGTMKLAEGLALRADAARRVEQLRARIVASARYQEGEEPAEDAAALLAEAGVALDDLEGLIRRVNRTNAAAQIGAGETITDALARRDVLRARHAVVTAAADAAAGRSQGGIGRQLRSELKMLAALPVAQLRAQADEIARELRELDIRIQRSNWEVDLLD